ncbi:MAG: diguanylate cyclase, partial [Candidatus Bipolaricaulota bacterium]
ARIVGYTLEELQPISIETWKDLTHPEDLNRSDKLLEKHFNRETDLYECEARMKHKNGDWVWVLDRGQVVEWNEEGEPIRMVGTHQNITDRREVEEELQEERDKLRKLHDAVDELQRQDTEQEVAETAVEVAESMLEFEFCAILFSDDGRLVPKANSNHMDSEKAPEFKIGEGIAGKTVETGETIWGEDVRSYDEAKPTEENFRAFISVPIGEIGTLVVVSKEVASFDEEDVELAEILAGHLQEEISRVRLEEELKDQAIRDPLTELYNRRYFNETLRKEVERSERYSRPIAFLMIDVNRFKEINDRYSHQTGDEVLREVAELLEDNVRDADTVVRYGGDEFLIMMPETDGEASHTVSRLRESMEEWNRDSDLLDFPLTLAIGSAHWSPEQDRDVEKALKEVDEKMYEDKRR